mmetsp:Transcript_23622/g.40152  ORF Transcript_23622/g.40152 Transcript_23622/m.40152 type:complete len:563 (-) Transcript_23622:335-2023(-)
MPTNPLRLKHIRSLASPKAKPGQPSNSSVPVYERSDYCQHNHPNKVYQGNMTEKKRQNAKDLLKKEELRSNKAKLAQIICQKLSNKFKRVPKSDIKTIVHKFVSNNNTIQASDLNNLENEIRALMASRKKAREQGSNLPGVNGNNPENDDDKGGIFGKSAPRQPCECAGCLVGGKCTVLPVGREWEALNMFQSYQAGLQEDREKALQKKKQRELKEALDKQVLEMKKRHETEKNGDQEYLRHITDDMRKFNDENQAKLEKEQAKFARERSFWEKQIADDKAMHLKEKNEMIRQEQRDLKRMQQKVAEEQRKIQEKRDHEAEIHRMILAENAKNKIIHQERMAMEKDDDNRIMAEYAARLDAEEKRRQDAFNKRMSDLEKIVQMADDGPVGKGRRDEEKREEELLLKQQLAKEEADARRERNDLHAKMERDRLMALHNKQILEEQERAKKAAKKSDQAYSEHYKRISKEYQSEVERSRRAEYEKALRQRQALQEQMNSKRQAEEDMNAVERSINYDTINGIREDLTFQGRLQHRVRMARGQGSRPNTPNSARAAPKTKKNGWM